MLKLFFPLMCVCFMFLGLSVFLICCNSTPNQPIVKKIVFIAGPKSHGPGEHEYEKDLKLLKYCLDTSPNLPAIETELHLNGWPEDPSTLDNAATIVLFSDGADHAEANHPFLIDDRWKIIEKQVQRGCGLVFQHYATILPRRLERQIFNWIGGYFDYESGTAPNHWYSKIKWATTTPEIATPNHPIVRGLRPFSLHEEYYYHLRFPEADSGFHPIWTTPIPGEAQDFVVAWAIQRPDGGRGFATTCGHSHDNFQHPSFRKLHLNAIVWTAGIDVPPGGVTSQLPHDWSFNTKLKDTTTAQKPVRALIVTGNDHPAHKWRETSLAVRNLLWQDERFLVDITHDPETLAHPVLRDYDVILLHYCNWESPGLSVAAQNAFLNYLKQGGGLCILHFANGAFHYSLPKAGDSDWPEYRKICRRVWDHHADSAHDPYGKFRVEIMDSTHFITRGMASFETVDELYYHQKGDLPIEVLATAHSKNLDKMVPMAWVYQYHQARVFQTVLGHSVASYQPTEMKSLIINGCLWAARREK